MHGRTTDNRPWHKLAGQRPVELKIARNTQICRFSTAFSALCEYYKQFSSNIKFSNLFQFGRTYNLPFGKGLINPFPNDKF